jgi:aspartyl/asparaginyl beta-hydroxylase (cupin superfamily)
MTALDGVLRTVGLLNRLFRRHVGGAQRPAFFDVDATYPALRLLDRNYAVIREELLAVMQDQERIPRYHEISKAETYISGTVDPARSWRVFMLAHVSGGIPTNQARCPRTSALLGQIPGLLQAFFSILDPGKSIPAHDGPYLGYLRYHLALLVPRVDPPSMRVKDQVHTWQEGRSILFDDSWNHQVYNTSPERRVVLIVDVVRPMAWPLHVINWLVTRVLARYSEEVREIRANVTRYANRL